MKLSRRVRLQTTLRAIVRRKDQLAAYNRSITRISSCATYRVRVFQGGADKVTRVPIEFGAGAGETYAQDY